MFADTNDTNKEAEEVPRRSSKVIIAETSTNIVARPAIETLKKSLLKSTSSSLDKPVILDVMPVEVRSPSPIPEDPIGEEISKQSTSSTMFDQEKKIEEKENTQEQHREKDEEASEKEMLEGQKEEERVKDENKCQQSGNNSDNNKQEILKTNREIDGKKCTESDTKEQKPEVAPVQITKLQGKSKTTGRVMEGWI